MSKDKKHICNKCNSIMLINYTECPHCQLFPPESQIERARKVVRDGSEDAFVQYLLAPMLAEIQCSRCHTIKRPEDNCCFDDEGKLILSRITS